MLLAHPKVAPQPARVRLVGLGETSLNLEVFAYYMTRDKGLDRKQSKGAVAEVQAWRDDGELPFPDFDDKLTEKHRDTLDYTPTGSPERDQGE